MSTTEHDIDNAITAFVRDHGRPDIVTGWIVLTALTTITDNGDEGSGIELIFAGGSMPWTQSLGLVEAARLRLHKQFGDDR